MAGYQLFFSLVVRHFDQQLVQRLDQDQYADEDLFQMAIPLRLPYYSSQTDYERIDGEVSYQGVYFHYVKRKVANDTLYILCLKNETKTKLHSGEVDFAKRASDLPMGKDNASGKKVISLSEHNVQPVAFSFTTAAYHFRQHFLLFASPLYSTLLDGYFRPPRSVWVMFIFH